MYVDVYVYIDIYVYTYRWCICMYICSYMIFAGRMALLPLAAPVAAPRIAVRPVRARLSSAVFAPVRGLSAIPSVSAASESEVL